MEDNNLKSDELDLNVAINVVGPGAAPQNASATTGYRCRFAPSPLAKGSTSDCVDTFASLGSIFTLIYSVDDYSYE